MNLKFANAVKRNWIINEKTPLDSQYRWGQTKGIISFIYCPRTKEFSLGLAKRHKELVQDFKTTFSEFVRGIYIKEKGKIILRAYAIEEIENYERQFDVVEALNLESYKIKFNASRDELLAQGWT